MMAAEEVGVELVVLAGVVGQVLALRLLVIQLARTPDDPRLVGRRPVGYAQRERRRRRHRLLVRLAVGAFGLATAVTIGGVIALLVP